jgi:3-phosphoshikimate 1-carboxyvinyltransferase
VVTRTFEPRSLAIDPLSVVRGEWRASGSKSIAQRAIVIAALSSGTTRLVGLPRGDDVAAARRLLAAVGVEHHAPTPASLSIVGRPPAWRGGWRPASVEAGESGTLARLCIASLALCSQPGESVEVRASGSLAARSSRALIEALERGGVEVLSRTWPIRLRAIGPPSTLVLERPESSQEASALAIALAAYPDENELRIEGELPSRPYFELTRAVLAQFSARVELVKDERLDDERNDEREVWRVRGPLRAPLDPLAIEPDASLAAVALAAACLSGGELTALGLQSSSAQGDVRIVEHLRAFGCFARPSTQGLRASGFPQRGAELDLRGEPDLAPVLAMVAAGAALVAPSGSTRSVLGGLETLNRKESRRLDVLSAGLRAAGWRAEARDGALWLDAPPARLEQTPLELHSSGDHRMAFAFALLGLLRAGVVVHDANCVAKSWPSFWRDMGELGLRSSPA